VTTTPRWVGETALILLHAESLAEHGGLEGIRDERLLESTLIRPIDLHAYEGVTDPARIASAYATGIARKHPFTDGNIRAAFLALGTFLALNGWRLTADKVDATRTMRALAAGKISEDALTTWIAQNLAPLNL
jgi:death-on-curing protein